MKVIFQKETPYGLLQFTSKRHTCQSKFKTGRSCNRNTNSFLNGAPLCREHADHHLILYIDSFDKFIERNVEIDNLILIETIKERIMDVYKKAKEYRKVPPDEKIANYLLHEIQESKCLICQDSNGLIEDHCHRTGMVRGLLCRSCNTVEGLRDDEEPWLTYRKYSPANGWFYRYRGAGEQWLAGYPDPLPNRINMNIEIKDFINGEIKDKVNIYKDIIKTKEKTRIPYTCKRIFDRLDKKPIPFDNEIIIEIDSYNQWPFKAVKPLPEKIKSIEEIDAEYDGYKNHPGKLFL